MAKVRMISSTGNQEEDAKLLADVKGSLTNKLSREEARERERQANISTATEPSRNALTDEPRIKGQLLTVFVEEDVADEQQTPVVKTQQSSAIKPVAVPATTATTSTASDVKTEERSAEVSK